MKRFHLTIFQKILLSISVLVLGYCLSMIQGQQSAQRAKDDFQRISVSLLPASILIREAQNHFGEQVKLYEQAVLGGEAHLIENANEQHDRIQQRLASMAALESLNQAKTKEIRELEDLLKRYTQDASQIYGRFTQSDTDIMDETEMDTLQRLAKERETASERFSALTASFSEDLDEEITDTLRYFDRLKKINLISFAFGLTVSLLLLAWVVRKTITRPVSSAVRELGIISDTIAQSSTNISGASRSLAQGASEQASSVEETSASLEEVLGMTRQNQKSAQESEKIAAEAIKIVGQVDQRIQQMAEAMSKITRSAEETGQIVKLINEIAFQTNLLALNAAVEAARAGDSGRGFAVVAEEVRSLAGKSAKAADSTTALIEGTIEAVQDGNELVSSTLTAFQENVQISTKIRDISEQILASSKEQAMGIDEISRAISYIETIAQTAAARSEESAEAAEKMDRKAADMTNVVENLEMMVKGGSAKKSKEIAFLPHGESRSGLQRSTR
jgi:methyl-accepting chemotaxis protein